MPKEGILERFARRRFETIKIDGILEDETYILNEQELAVIKKVRIKALVYSAILGALGVLFLYLPQYFLPELFPETAVSIFGFNLMLPLVGWAWALVLVIVEIYCLNIVNIQAVARIAAACHFPKKDSANYQMQLSALMGAALEKPATNINSYGINPFFGLPRFSYGAYFIFNKAKATLSNALVKVLVSRLVGRVGLRQIADMAGIPIFAFWNAWASHLVIKEATLRIMTPDAIDNFVSNLQKEYSQNEIFKTLLNDALQFIAILKRDYNYGHFLLADSLFKHFGLESKTYNNNFVSNFTKADNVTQLGLLKVIIVGTLIDGHISKRETAQLETLTQINRTYTTEQIKTIANNFKNGKGLSI